MRESCKYPRWYLVVGVIFSHFTHTGHIEVDFLTLLYLTHRGFSVNAFCCMKEWLVVNWGGWCVSAGGILHQGHIGTVCCPCWNSWRPAEWRGQLKLACKAGGACSAGSCQSGSLSSAGLGVDLINNAEILELGSSPLCLLVIKASLSLG